ncbi:MULTISPECIES: hypothetical protein [unclassified Pseudarthrobacter]|uniref:hypothetical protein n=1 Tax=unclassified Pseudarthrobacter TaxID=2647000 RepID=UPI00362F2EFC
MAVARMLRQADGKPQLLQPPVHGPGPQRCPAGIQVGPHGCRSGRCAGIGLRIRVEQCAADLRRQRQPQFLPVKVAAVDGVRAGLAVLARGYERLHQDGVAVRVEGVPLQGKGCQFGGLAGGVRCQCRQGSLVQQ